MGYINKSYLQKQLENLAARISAVFAKSTDIPTKTSQLENDSDYVDNSMVGVSKDDEGITNIEYTLYSVEAGGKAKLNGETSLRDAVANSTSYIATNMQKLDEKIPTTVEPVNNLLATVAGSPLDAVQGKFLNDKVSRISTYVSDDGKLHFVDSEGADTELPFSSGGLVKLWEGTATSYANGYSFELDTSGYSQFLVEVKYQSTTNFSVYYIVEIGTAFVLATMVKKENVSGGQAVHVRTITISDNTVTFTSATNSARCIPVAIYGISSIV